MGDGDGSRPALPHRLPVYKVELYNDARDHLEVLVDDDDPTPNEWLRAHPSALYYLGRSEYFDADPQTGLMHLERYKGMRPVIPGAESSHLVTSAGDVLGSGVRPVLWDASSCLWRRP